MVSADHDENAQRQSNKIVNGRNTQSHAARTSSKAWSLDVLAKRRCAHELQFNRIGGEELLPAARGADIAQLSDVPSAPRALAQTSQRMCTIACWRWQGMRLMQRRAVKNVLSSPAEMQICATPWTAAAAAIAAAETKCQCRRA
jgi:hypothetical protein